MFEVLTDALRFTERKPGREFAAGQSHRALSKTVVTLLQNLPRLEDVARGTSIGDLGTSQELVNVVIATVKDADVPIVVAGDHGLV